MIFWYILIALLAFLLSFVVGGIIYAYIRTYKMPKKRAIYLNENQKNEVIKAVVREIEALPYEEVFIKSYDGTRLFGRYIHIADDAPVHIICHGYRGFAMKDSSGAAKACLTYGHNMIIIDQRGHGKSGSNTTCFGLKERYDILEWARYAYKRFGKDVPIFLNGASMGGNAVLMSIALDLPKTVVGVISDGAFSAPSDVIKFTIEYQHIPKILLPYPTTYIAGLFCGFNLNASSAVKAVSNSKMPILLFHGTTDTIVPYKMAQRIFDASISENKFLHLFEGAGHVLCYATNPDKYLKAFKEFTDLCLKNFNI